MAHAYTPGLIVTERILLHKERRLPIMGEVLVKKGETVLADTIVARTYLPGKAETINVAGLLGILPEDVEECMLKKVGETVLENEEIAKSKGFFGLFKSSCKSPASGTIESVSNVTGQVIIRGAPEPVAVAAYIDGKVVEVMENEGVVVETVASFIQGIFGVGGETYGEIRLVADDPNDLLTPEEIDEDCKGKILIGGSLVTSEVVEKGVKVGAKAIVAGGIGDQDLKRFLGYDLGVAITGSEEKGITLVITEGFGRMRMADQTFALLKSKEGFKASVNGATQIRAGVMRPEVIVPLDSTSLEKIEEKPREMGEGLVIGSLVRVIREPYFGKLGRVTLLPSELQTLETEAKVRILEVEFEDGKRAIIPRANVEMIEG